MSFPAFPAFSSDSSGSSAGLMDFLGLRRKLREFLLFLLFFMAGTLNCTFLGFLFGNVCRLWFLDICLFILCLLIG